MNFRHVSAKSVEYLSYFRISVELHDFAETNNSYDIGYKVQIFNGKNIDVWESLFHQIINMRLFIKQIEGKTIIYWKTKDDFQQKQIWH